MAPRSTYSRERITVVRRYPWPSVQLNWWIIVMLAAGGLILGVFADFVSIQNQFGLGIPWLFPYGITVGALTVLFLIVMLIMLAQKNLDPDYVILGCFILIVLYITGLIETAIQLFGNGNVSSTCNNYVSSQKITGVSLDTLAWLEQNAICNEWDAVFAFWIIGMVFLIWMIIMASQVKTANSRSRGSRRERVVEDWD
ncbi:hypothetical protein AAFC00_000345 [Neodothiora populina]|uniref:Tetraspanin n=1 Tax=Neodothiora populina TaxID=2781224 RepID=A0ABR3PDS4_9PEZI